MEKNENLLDISEIIAAPVLISDNDDYMWTGLIMPDDITHHIISNPSLRNEFEALTRAVQKTTREYRETHRNLRNKVFSINSEAQLNEKILALGQELLGRVTAIKEWIRAHAEDDLDVGLFGVCLCREYEKVLANNPEEFKYMEPRNKKLLEKFRTGFVQMSPIIRELYVNNNNYYTCHLFLTDGQRKKNFKNSSQNGSNLVDLLEHVAQVKDISSTEGTALIKEIFGIIELSDLSEIFQSEEYADMQTLSILKNYLLEKGFKAREVDKMSTKEITTEAAKTYTKDSDEIHPELIARTIIDGIEYLDLEKLLVIAIARRLEHLENDRGTLRVITDEHIKESKRTEEIARRILEMNMISKKAKAKIYILGEDREVSFKRIDELMKNFCDGMYITDTLEQKLKIDVYFEHDEMSNWSDELVKRFNYSEEDKEIMSMVNFENLKRLYELGKLDKQDIKNILMKLSNGIENGASNFVVGFPSVDGKIRNNAKNFFRNVFDSNLIDENELRQYFEEGVVTPEMLETLESERTDEELEKVHEKLKKSFTQEMLLAKYQKYAEKYVSFMNLQTSKNTTPEEIETLRIEVNRLRTEKDICKELFEKYNQITLEEERHEQGEEFIEKYYFDMEVTDEQILEESIKVMYEDGMIDLENIINLDKNYIIPMLDTLSLDDASKVRKSMTFEALEEMLDKVFDNQNISDERKFIIVMNLLNEDTEKDKELRELYLSLLEFDDSERKAKSKGKKKEIELDTDGTSKSSNKYIYPDIVKWKFYKGLDKDVRVTRYANGFVEFASSKLGARIIEKYYDGNKPAYGTATYVLSEQEYRRNQGDLITIKPTGNILETTTLKEITPRKDRIAHRTHSTERTWMDQIVKYFDIDYERQEDSRYTQEELQALQSTVKALKNQYEMIEEK